MESKAANQLNLCIDFLTQFRKSGFSATQTQESHSNIGKYQITDDGGGGLFYILDTETGFVQKYAKEGKDTYKVKRTVQTK